MANTKVEITELGNRIANLDSVVCRVQVFNELVPWVRRTCPRYSIIDFYEKALGNIDWTRSGGTVKWDNVEAKAVVLKEAAP